MTRCKKPPKVEKEEFCEICKCKMNKEPNGPKQATTHHKIPKPLRKTEEDCKEQARICNECHRAFNRYVAKEPVIGSTKEHWIKLYERYLHKYQQARKDFAKFIKKMGRH